MVVWRLPEAPFTCIRPISLSCALRNSAFGLQVRVISEKWEDLYKGIVLFRIYRRLENALGPEFRDLGPNVSCAHSFVPFRCSRCRREVRTVKHSNGYHPPSASFNGYMPYWCKLYKVQ